MKTERAKLVDWLLSLGCKHVKPVDVTIRGATYHGASYVDPKHPGNDERLMLLGELPAPYRRSTRTAFVIDGADWYIATYWNADHAAKVGRPAVDDMHPFAAEFMLCKWEVPDGTTIDRYEPRPYTRVEAQRT